MPTPNELALPVTRPVRESGRLAFPSPAPGEIVEYMPPTLVFLPGAGGPYTVVVMREGEEILRAVTDRTYIIADTVRKPGVYTWDVYTPTSRRGEESFTVSEDALLRELPSAGELLDAVPGGHPRHLFLPSDLPALRERVTIRQTLASNVALAMSRDLPELPRFESDPSATPYREYFGYFRDVCDRDLVALALAFRIEGDMAAGRRGRELLLHLCRMEPSREASLLMEGGKHGDEIGLSMARVLPSVYDLLYDLLSPDERETVEGRILAYALQCEARLRRIDYAANPSDSHAGRLPAYLGEAALVLADSPVLGREAALRLLGYALEIYLGTFPFYGGRDGGWAEGVFYATSYIKWFLPFFSAVERYTGKSLFGKPFYRRVTDFLLHFADPTMENHPFGDGYWCHPSDPEWPGFFAENPFRYYAERFGGEEVRALSEACERRDHFRLHLLDLFLPTPPHDARLSRESGRLAVFREAGFAAMHAEGRGRGLTCLVRASRFGSDSHRHPDQGSFALFFRGRALVSPSGYFGRRYGTRHHSEWLNATRAHNALLFDGEGQYRHSHLAVGEISSFAEEGERLTLTVSAGGAYPRAVQWHRTFSLEGDTLTVRDEVLSDTPVSVTYPLHFLALPQADGNKILLSHRGVLLEISPRTGGLADLVISDRFEIDLNEGELREYHVTMPPQFHAKWTSPRRMRHSIEVVYRVRGCEL